MTPSPFDLESIVTDPLTPDPTICPRNLCGGTGEKVDPLAWDGFSGKCPGCVACCIEEPPEAPPADNDDHPTDPEGYGWTVFTSDGDYDLWVLAPTEEAARAAAIVEGCDEDCVVALSDTEDCDNAPTPDTREILARVAEIEGRVGKAPAFVGCWFDSGGPDETNPLIGSDNRVIAEFPYYAPHRNRENEDLIVNLAADLVYLCATLRTLATGGRS